MNFWNNLFEGVTGAWSGGIAHSIIILAVVIALGKILGRSKIAGISLGVTWVLFVGILFSHFNMTLDYNLLHYLKEFGLILFVFSIGLQVGPGFVHSFKSGGLALNLLAVFVCLSGAGIAIAIHFITGTPVTTMTGIMSGAVTNTPGLGAAQTAFQDSFGGGAPDIALGYAVAYPLGVVGAILSFILLRILFFRTPAGQPSGSGKSQEKASVKAKEEPDVVALFAGIAFGVLLGSIPIHFPGVPQPVKLGLAGGPLVVSIVMGWTNARRGRPAFLAPAANQILREVGICIFLACVGLEAGDGFVDTIVNKGGYVWIAYGALITVIPLMLAGMIGRFLLKLDYSTLIGVLAGSCTNPPALAFANEQDPESDRSAVGYATVYPLTMFMRVLIAQLIILFLC